MNRIVLVLTAITGLSWGQSDRFEWRGTLPANGRLEIRGINGDIRAEPASGALVEVTAVKTGRRSDPESVEIQVVEDAGGVTICAVYPNRDASKPNECKPGGGRMNVQDNDVKVDFTVRVPSSARLDARTVNGRIDAGRLAGDVSAHTVNGKISVDAAGCAMAKTVNGSIDVTFSPGSCSSAMRFETVNGGITLALAGNANANVHAETVNGGISSEFPLTLRGKLSQRRLDATIGAGGQELSLKTVNGGIELRRSSI
jgi:DUF4097 and DUF4098 domain-containing protein YvlB